MNFKGISEELEPILAELKDLQKRYFYRIEVSLSINSNFSQTITVTLSNGNYVALAAETAVIELIKMLNDNIDTQCKSLFDYINSEDCARGQLENGEFEFLENGEIYN